MKVIIKEIQGKKYTKKQNSIDSFGYHLPI